ncbi:PA0069 family radical SAM protein [Myxococcota bacterium]|nr:PA0069 family radical SAM protein [Myxococcota bacterium]
MSPTSPRNAKPPHPIPGGPLIPEPAAARKGRGALANPTGRFERFAVELDLEALAEAERADEEQAGHPAPRRTQFLPDPSRTALTFNQSPDIPFDASLNPYRGCEHGCAYCYARPTHEYLGYSAGLDFETKILVKERAPELLRRELASPRWVPQVVALSGVTDAYQPVERRLGLTRRCIEVFAEFRNPITIITKNALVTRDVDLFQSLASFDAVSVSLSIGSLDPEIQRTLEPRASSIPERLRAIEALARAGIPTGVMMGPVIPGLTDHEMPAILEASKNAGASHASYIVLRLPFGLKALFDDWLRTHQPLRRDKVLHRLESLRDGRLNDPRFGTRMRGEGHFADQIGATFRIWARRHGFDGPRPALSTAAFRRPAHGNGNRNGGPQLELGF